MVRIKIYGFLFIVLLMIPSKVQAKTVVQYQRDFSLFSCEALYREWKDVRTRMALSTITMKKQLSKKQKALKQLRKKKRCS